VSNWMHPVAVCPEWSLVYPTPVAQFAASADDRYIVVGDCQTPRN
jgi:hypothetical protein